MMVTTRSTWKKQIRLSIHGKIHKKCPKINPASTVYTHDLLKTKGKLSTSCPENSTSLNSSFLKCSPKNQATFAALQHQSDLMIPLGTSAPRSICTHSSQRVSEAALRSGEYMTCLFLMEAVGLHINAAVATKTATVSSQFG